MVTWWITDASEDDEGGDHGWSAGRGGGAVVGKYLTPTKAVYLQSHASDLLSHVRPRHKWPR